MLRFPVNNRSPPSSRDKKARSGYRCGPFALLIDLQNDYQIGVVGRL